MNSWETRHSKCHYFETGRNSYNKTAFDTANQNRKTSVFQTLHLLYNR